MLKNKFKFVYLLLIGAVSIGMQSCSDDDDEDENMPITTQTTIDFEDLEVDSKGYWIGDTTGIASEGQWGATDYKGSFSTKTTTFENTLSVSSYGQSWMGFGYSTLADSTVDGVYTNEMYVYGKSGANGSKTFAVAFSDNATITFDKAVNLKNVKVNNSTYTYKVIRDGNAYTDGPFKKGSWFSVTFTGFDANGKKAGETTYYLADYRNGKSFICKDWTQVDLSGLKGVKKVVLTFDGSDKGDYGLNTPTYVCLDNLVF
ncbi:MAG: DUF4465 domain-containing protein [Paludibacteraceae bacterium]|nr:DUF4465 domain-containing protein [Paludibacteraceae bacterium]